MSLVVDEHREYLADRARLGAYERAIAAVVRPGDVVLDLGAGTGILGLLACRAGAARVYAVEETSMVGLARELARANGLLDRITHIRSHSAHATLPEPADVVVCDQIGRFGFEAGAIEHIEDVRRRGLVRAGARTIPLAIEFSVAPAECPDGFAHVEFWRSRPAGFDFTPARAIAANTGYPRAFGSGELLAAPMTCGKVDLARESPRPLRLEARCAIDRAGTLHGVAGWFAAALAPGVVMTNSPLAPDRINRRNVFFPIDRAVAVEPGDRVGVSMQVLPEDSLVSWRVEVWGRDRAPVVFAHSTWRGMLVDRDELEHTRPGHVPRLTPRGRARLTVLELADGRRSIADIEQELQRRHAGLFRTPGEAATFVAEVMTRYAE